MKQRYLAFFDVDGTLINVRSQISFLDFARAHWQWDSAPWFRTYHAELHHMIRSNTDYTHLNAFFYTAFKGLNVDAVAKLGAQWFNSLHGTPGFYNNGMLTVLRQHQEQGARIVFVTGSCTPLMEPLASYLKCDALLCSELEIRGDTYTGSLIGKPCIGEEKAVRAEALAQQEDIPMAQCHAYGDHHSDIPLLQAVGCGRMVEPPLAYLEEFTTRDWFAPVKKPNLAR